MSTLKRAGSALTSQDQIDIRRDISLPLPTSGDAGSGQVVTGGDSRLTNARTPTAHTHTASAVTDFSTAADARIAAASINALADVTVTSPSTGQVLKWSGTAWVNDTDSTGGGAGATNLSYTASPTNGIVVSDTGTDATVPLADATNAGLQSPANFTKLAGIAANATANATDAQLRDRATHTGSQAISTVTGLQTALDGKETVGAATSAVSAHVAAGDPHTQYALESSLSAVATTGAYADLSGLPTLGTAAAAATGDFATAAQGTKADSAAQIAGDLSGTPAAPVVAKINGVAITGTPSVGQSPVATSATTATWQTPSGGGSGTKTLATFTPMTSQPPASAFATLDTRNSIAVLDFDDASVESTTFVGVIPEAADLASGIIARLHWTATSATSGNVRWRVEFERAGTDIDSDSFDTATEATSAANGTSGIETAAAITCTTIDSLAAGDRFRVRISRVGNDGTNDTMTGDAELIAVELRAA